MIKKVFVLFCCLYSLSASADVSFVCKESKNQFVSNQPKVWLEDVEVSKKEGNIVLGLKKEKVKTETRFFKIEPEFVFHPVLKKDVEIVSKKEILWGLLSPGRQLVLPGCDVSVLEEHVELRQNIVLWASNLEWGWPDGESAFWNQKLWNRGTPLGKELTYVALFDAFSNQGFYSIGCYAATKIIYSFGMLDYYKRVNPNEEKYNRLVSLLWSDGDPLINIEPPEMWHFEPDYTTSKEKGKLLVLQENVDGSSIVPGDWLYFLNTDAETYKKIGYEGSNAIYLGRNVFADYYNDNAHQYTFEEKIDEVYQWRNGVFSRSRDGHKATPLTESDYRKLEQAPEEGGLLLRTRLVPHIVN